jgi:hypothetical protein
VCTAVNDALPLLNGADKLPLVRAGVRFVDGIQQERNDNTNDEDGKDDAA